MTSCRALKQSNEDLESAQEEMRLRVRHYIGPKTEHVEAIGPDDLVADLATARKLLKNPPSLDTWDTPALVVAAVLEAHLLSGVPTFQDDALSFAADTVLRIGEGETWPRGYEVEETFSRRAPTAAPHEPFRCYSCQLPLAFAQLSTKQTGGRPSSAPLVQA